MAMAMATTSVSDSDLAFQMQMNEALAASMGISSVDHGRGTGLEEVSKDAVLALQGQEMELERLQREALDVWAAANERQRLSQQVAQELHDAKVAREIAAMAEEEWEESGDLFEKPFVAKEEDREGIFRLFFKGFPVCEGDRAIGVALGGAILNSSGIAVVELKRYVDVPSGKTISQYIALVDALDAARSLGARKIIAYTDCYPLYRQLEKTWRISTSAGRKLFQEATERIAKFEDFDLNLALHGENWPAENLARLACMSRKLNTPSTSKTMEHCIICFEDTSMADMYTLKECGHRFCSSCVKQHVEAKVTAGQIFPVPCPQMDCGKVFTEIECRSLLSGKSLELFLKRLEEARIPEAYRVYCPYPNCSELMDKRTFGNQNRAMQCGTCRRNFCVECRVPWHTFLTCSDYQRLPPELRDVEDAKLYRLADNQNWRQCKQCRRMIELSEGCYHMTCRCGYEFCYTCGAPWRNKIQTCFCKLWDEDRIIREPYEEDDDTSEDDEEYDRAPRFYKTQLCRYFEMGYCRNGAACNFAHGRGELRI